MLIMAKKALVYIVIGTVVIAALVGIYILIQKSDYQTDEDLSEEQLTEGDSVDDIEKDLNTVKLEDLQGDLDSLDADISALEKEL